MLLANSLIQGFLGSNMMGRGIVAAQIAGSVIMLALIIGKWRELNFLTGSTRRFIRDFESFGDTLSYQLKRHPLVTIGIETVYRVTCEKLIAMVRPDPRNPAATVTALSPREVELVASTCEHALDDEELKLERGMGIIATIVAMEPMLGLLGTVWGVLDAFADMGTAGSANLATIAPSISSALVTTVVGLIVAIFGVCCSNWMNGRIRELSSTFEAFADELSGRLAIEYQGKEA